MPNRDFAWAHHDSKHQCLALECSERIPTRHMMCAAHWRWVPSSLRDRLFKTFHGGDTEGWPAAVADAQAAVTRGEESAIADSAQWFVGGTPSTATGIRP